jgi:hypothetical protein
MRWFRERTDDEILASEIRTAATDLARLCAAANNRGIRVWFNGRFAKSISEWDIRVEEIKKQSSTAL